jgi:hypothetical protein
MMFVLDIYEFYFFPARITKNAMSAITAITIKMPKPIPALNIPAIALHELRVEEMSTKINTESLLKFFIAVVFI